MGGRARDNRVADETIRLVQHTAKTLICGFLALDVARVSRAHVLFRRCDQLATNATADF